VRRNHAKIILTPFLATALANSVWGQVQRSDELQAEHPVRKHADQHTTTQRRGPHDVTEELRTGDISPKPWLDWEHATGDWAGVRPWLDDHGLTLDISYTADFFYNLGGGLNTSDADQYRGLLGIGLTVDTEKLGLWENGTFFVNMLENHGRDITERHVGDLQALNNADAPNHTRLYEFWYEHALFDGALRVKLGKMDANVDFAAPDYGGEFIHSSAGFSPTIQFPTWPDPALGIAVFVEPVEWLYLQAGLYDAEGTGTRGGFDTAFHSPDDVVVMWEMGVRPTLRLFGQADLPGTYRVGGFYHTGEWDEYFNDLGGRLAPQAHRGNSGVYVVLDQLLLREHPDDDEKEQGLGAFFQFAWAPSDYNEITQHYGAGFQYVGLIPERDDDVFGVAAHHVSLSGKVQSLEKRHSETAIEAFYKYQLTEFVSIKPDVQYIVNPGGNGRDAVVAGVRVEITL
jgi:porin